MISFVDGYIFATYLKFDHCNENNLSGCFLSPLKPHIHLYSLHKTNIKGYCYTFQFYIGKISSNFVALEPWQSDAADQQVSLFAVLVVKAKRIKTEEVGQISSRT